jgi:hypothetical protein
MAHQGITDHTRKRLWWHSRGKCAFPGCQRDLIESTIDGNEDTIVGQECHIVAKRDSPAVARSLGLLTPEERRRFVGLIKDRHGFENLVLMCANHARIIDDPAQEYSVADVLAMKHDHERSMRASGYDLMASAIQAEGLVSGHAPYLDSGSLQFELAAGEESLCLSSTDVDKAANLLGRMRPVGLLVGDVGAGKSLFLYWLTGALAKCAEQDQTQPRPVLVRASTLTSLPAGALLSMVQPDRLAPDRPRALLLIDELDQVAVADRILAEALTVGEAGLADVTIAFESGSRLLRHPQLSGRPRVALKPLNEAHQKRLAGSLLEGLGERSDRSLDDRVQRALELLPSLPLYVELACFAASADLRPRDPAASVGEMLKAILEGAMSYGSEAPGRAEEILKGLGDLTWRSAEVRPSGMVQVQPSIPRTSAEAVLRGAASRALLKPSPPPKAMWWRHARLAHLVLSYWLSFHSVEEIVAICRRQQIGNSRLRGVLALAIAWSEERDAAVIELGKGRERVDVALEGATLLRTLAALTPPEAWDAEARRPIVAALGDLVEAEGPEMLSGVGFGWIRDTDLAATLRQLIESSERRDIAAWLVREEPELELIEPAMTLLRSCLSYPEKFDLDIPRAVLVAGTDQDCRRALECLRACVSDDEAHGNARFAAVGELDRFARATESDELREEAVDSLEKLVEEAPATLAIRAARGILHADEAALDRLVERLPPLSMSQLIAGFAAAEAASRALRRRGWQVVREAEEKAEADEVREIAAQLLATRRQAPHRVNTLVGSKRSGAWGWSGQRLVAAIRSSENMHEAAAMVGVIAENGRRRDETKAVLLEEVIEDSEVHEYPRLNACVRLYALIGDPDEIITRALSEVVETAHPITARMAAEALQAIGADMDVVVRRFQQVGEEFFFSQVASGVLGGIPRLDAFHGLATILTTHTTPVLLSELRRGLATIRPSISATEWEEALTIAAEATQAVDLRQRLRT